MLLILDHRRVVVEAWQPTLHWALTGVRIPAVTVHRLQTRCGAFHWAKIGHQACGRARRLFLSGSAAGSRTATPVGFLTSLPTVVCHDCNSCCASSGVRPTRLITAETAKVVHARRGVPLRADDVISRKAPFQDALQDAGAPRLLMSIRGYGAQLVEKIWDIGAERIVPKRQ